MSLFVKFWGTRGSIPTPGPKTQRYGGNTACVEIRAGETTLICDGGTGLRALGDELLRRHQGKPITVHLFFSHPHWDHIQGFPFFTPAYAPANTLFVYGAAKEDQAIHQLLSGQMQSSYFPVSFSELDAKIVPKEFDERMTMVDGIKVTSFPQKHPGGSLGLAFEHQRAKVVYATDNELDQSLLDPSAPERRPEELRSFPASVLAAAKGADLLIADGQYTDGEYTKKVGWGHPRATTVVDFAIQAGVRQVAITHHDPMQSDHDVDEKIAICSARALKLGAKDLVIFGAREGIELKIG